MEWSLKCNNHRSFWVCIEEDSGRVITWLSWRHRYRKNSVFKIFPIHDKTEGQPTSFPGSLRDPGNEVEGQRFQIGYFRVPLCLSLFKARLSGETIVMKMTLHESKIVCRTHFYLKSFAFDSFWNRGTRELGSDLHFEEHIWKALFSWRINIEERPYPA